jgi:phosphate transport system permease protein
MKQISLLPNKDEQNQNTKSRHRIGRLWQSIFLFAILVGLIALTTLILTILNGAFGYVIVENKVDPETLASEPLEDLTAPELASILSANLSPNRLRALEFEKPLSERGRSDLYALVMERIVDPTVVELYTGGIAV